MQSAIVSAMIGKVGNILTGTQNAIVQSIKNTQRLLDKVQLRLASGKDVNSAIDNPSNFFLSLSLSQKADDYMRLLDNIQLNMETIKATMTGVDAISKLIDLADTMLAKAKEELYSGAVTSLTGTLTDIEIASILAANPGLTYSTDTHSFYMLGAGSADWDTAFATAGSATLTEPAGVAGIAGVPGHLAVVTSQEENDFIHALAPMDTWIAGSDRAVEGEWRWVAGPETGQQFWQGGPGGSAVNGMYTNWLGAEPNNLGNEDTLQFRSSGLWNDQPATDTLGYVIEWDMSLFVPTPDPDLVARAHDYARQYSQLMEQIDMLARDTHYRGVGLLNQNDLRTDFNIDRSNFLITKGIDATSQGLGLDKVDFLRLGILEISQEQVYDARETLRTYLAGIGTDLNIITNRLDFTQSTINVHKGGAMDLVVADQNETGAELLALQLRQQLQTEAISLSTKSTVSQLFK